MIPFKLFKFPSRGRPERFFNSLDSIVNNISDKDYYYIAASLDYDDYTMNNVKVIERIGQYDHVHVSWGHSKSKVHAINRDMPNIPWDIVVCVSDDTIFNLFGFDVCMGVDMLNWFPDFDGLLHYPDQDAKQYLATLYCAGRKFYDRFGYIYNPAFKSLWCDNLVQDIAQKLGKYKYCGYQINLHLNPAYGHLPKDQMFLEQQGHWGEDEKMYYEIKSRNYDLDLLNQNNIT